MRKPGLCSHQYSCIFVITEGADEGQASVKNYKVACENLFFLILNNQIDVLLGSFRLVLQYWQHRLCLLIINLNATFHFSLHITTTIIGSNGGYCQIVWPPQQLNSWPWSSSTASKPQGCSSMCRCVIREALVTLGDRRAFVQRSRPAWEIVG